MSWRHGRGCGRRAQAGESCFQISRSRHRRQTLSRPRHGKKTTSPADGTVFQWQLGSPWGVNGKNGRNVDRKGSDVADSTRKTYLDVRPDAVRELFARVPRGPVVMLNLIRLREVADYAATPDRRGRRFTAAPTRRTYFERRARPVINPESRWGCQDLFCRLSGRRDAWGCVEASSRASLAWPSLRIPNASSAPRSGARESHAWDRRNSAILFGFESLG